jgi:chitin disaccharide deacetylase
MALNSRTLAVYNSRDVMMPGIAQRVRCSPNGLRRSGRRYVIFEADDLGLLYAFNEGIKTAFRAGILTSTCLRTNGLAYQHAIREVLPACPGLAVGVHLCLNEGPSVAPAFELPALLHRATSQFKPGYTWLMRLSRDRSGLRQIEREFRAQIEKALAAGVTIDHLNSHQHVHMIPAIFRLTCRLAREYGVPCVRLVRELPYRAVGLRRRLQPYRHLNFVKHVLMNRFARINEKAARHLGIRTPDYFVGMSYTARMSVPAVIGGLAALPYGTVEVLAHPAVGPDPRDAQCPDRAVLRYATAPQRRMELHSLCAPELAEFLREQEWRRTTFGPWAQEQRMREPSSTTPTIAEGKRRLCMELPVECPLWVSEAQADSRAFAQLALTQSQPGQRVLDLGTGTGIIAICLAKEGRGVVASDISRGAVRAARANARRHGVALEVLQSDLLDAITGRFDLIVFNPPYAFRPDNFATNVAKNVLRRVPWVRRQTGLALPRPVLKFHQELIARLVSAAPDHLCPGGALLIHAYEAEVPTLDQVLPPEATVELLEHSALRPLRTVGMLIRFNHT